MSLLLFTLTLIIKKHIRSLINSKNSHITKLLSRKKPSSNWTNAGDKNGVIFTHPIYNHNNHNANCNLCNIPYPPTIDKKFSVMTLDAYIEYTGILWDSQRSIILPIDACSGLNSSNITSCVKLVRKSLKRFVDIDYTWNDSIKIIRKKNDKLIIFFLMKLLTFNKNKIWSNDADCIQISIKHQDNHLIRLYNMKNKYLSEEAIIQFV